MRRLLEEFVRPRVLQIVRLRVWIAERFRPGEGAIMLAWAALIGTLGGIATPAFLRVLEWVQYAFTRHSGSLSEAAASLAWWERLLVPALGGLLAGLTLVYGSRITRGKRAQDYMEAISLGDGVIRAQPTLVRISSSLFSVASGGSIGREGAMSQLSAMLASLVGRASGLPRARLRLLVACGAASGIAAAYNAPIGGALFVAEVVLGSIAMESFGPLLLASVLSTVVSRAALGDRSPFQVDNFEFVSAAEIPTYLLLGLVLGAACPAFLGLLDASSRFFQRWPTPLWVRLAVGGLIVGALSIQYPYVWGNGANALQRLLNTEWTGETLAILLVFKLAATAVTVGSGAVGGVFTPTLLVGAVVGGLFGHGIHALLPDLTAGPRAYAIVGMGAFLAGTTHAPLTAILILFDMTLNHAIVLPLMVACTSAYSASRAIRKNSIYAHSLRQPADEPDAGPDMLQTTRVRDLIKPDPPHVVDKARFDEIVGVFARHQHHNLYVVDENHRFRGVIALHEIKPFLQNEQLAQVVIADDLLVEQFPRIGPDSTLAEALAKFATHAGERLPVVEPDGGWLVGSVTKTDLLLTLAHEVKNDGRDAA